MRRSSGTYPMPWRQIRSGGSPSRRSPSRLTLPSLGRTAGNGFQQRRLADAVAAENAYHLPRPRLDRHTLDDMGESVMDVKVVDPEHHAFPK